MGCRCASSISGEFHLFLRLELIQSKGMIQYKHCQVTDASLNVHVCFEKKRNKTDGEDKLGTYVSSERMNIKPD